VITANGSIISGHIPHERPSSLGGSLTSVCSCRCPQCPIQFRRGPRPPRRLTLTKSPAKITHLQQQPLERKSMAMAVYRRHPSAQVEVSATNAHYPGDPRYSTHQFSTHYQSHILPSESFDLSPSRSPSPILELFDSPPLRPSDKRMSV